ncbi:MAG: YdcF family protein [Deltaproteobacteria bacterium]|nr:YdcF family protein [Deltaproteobacteria bacterium]
MYWTIRAILKSFLLPTSFFLACGVLGLLMLRKKRRLSIALITSSLAGSYLTSLPVVSNIIVGLVEDPGLALLDPVAPNAQAIVILGGGRRGMAPELDGRDGPGIATLVRTAYGVDLHRRTKLPILVSGGSVEEGLVPEAELMRESLETTFQVPVRWVEDRSHNSIENAKFSAEIIQREGIRRILLVTQAWHMRRAVQAFSKAGFDVVPAPAFFESSTSFLGVRSWIPNAHSFLVSNLAVHEMWGYLLGHL